MTDSFGRYGASGLPLVELKEPESADGRGFGATQNITERFEVSWPLLKELRA